MPVQPPVSPFDLISTVFPATPTPTELPRSVPTIVERAGGLPILPNPSPAAIFRVTPTPLIAGPDSIIVEAVTSPDFPPFAGGGSIWFEDGIFIVKTDLNGRRENSFRVARSGPVSFLEAGGRLWVLDTSEGLLSSYSLNGEPVSTTPADFGSELRYFAGSLWVFASLQKRFMRFDLEGTPQSSFRLPAETSVVDAFDVTEDAIWAWQDETLNRYSLTGDLELTFAAPELPDREDIGTPGAQVWHSGSYLWMSGHSPTEIARIDADTGERVSVSLAQNPGESVSRTINVNMLLLGESVWVMYSRRTLPLDAGGTTQSQFRRIEVFNHEGGQIAELELDRPNMDLSLTHIPDLDEVWVVLGTAPGETLFRRIEINSALDQ